MDDYTPITSWDTDERLCLTPEQEAIKRDLYERINPRRRKFIDKIGYANWNPFQPPNDPIEIRKSNSGHTTQELIRMFFHDLKGTSVSNEYSQGALDTALGIVNKDDRTLGRYAFSLWYAKLCEKEHSKANTK